MDWFVLAIIASLVVGGTTSLGIKKYLEHRQLRSAKNEAERLLAEGRAKQREIILEAKEEALKIKSRAEEEIRERRAELHRLERKLSQKEEYLERRAEGIERKESLLITKEKEINALYKQLEELKQKEIEQLEHISGLSSSQAKELLFKMIEEEVRGEISKKVRQWEEEIRSEAEARARRILSEAIQRCATEVVAETTTTIVPLPSDEMKGRLIGREGRNIRAIEQATGVELIIDDTPEVVVISSFDPIRREIARIALNKLILDGRIHPARIEEMVEKAKAEVEAEIQRRGEEAALKAGVLNLHPELIKLLGKLHYRTSYGQNILAHSLEVAHLSSLLASELGADVEVAKRAGLLHDIGKALDHQVEGPHALIGAKAIEAWERTQVVQAIAQHHGETDITSVEGFIVAAADAISGARPGARKEVLEQYIKRLRDLESIAMSFPGVEKAYAIQAGREVRILVKPEKIDDLGIVRLARDIAKKIEESMQYPGQIKITVIREKRAVDYAK